MGGQFSIILPILPILPSDLLRPCSGWQGRSLFNVYPISEWSILPFGFNPTCFNSEQICLFLFKDVYLAAK